jgi:RNA polymerase sigma-70 factor (ECF subfamily)
MKGLQRGIASAELNSLMRDGVAGSLSDGELLKRFAGSRDQGGELAFAVLVARHGPMVLGVCRRILRDPTEADDAFQATFLVLARRAGAIRLGDSLGPWLHGVTRRVARRLHSVAVRRASVMREDERIEWIPDRRRDVMEDVERRLELKESLDALPAIFRDALILCYLDGLTHEEAAQKLGCPVGTVRSRLARGRDLLRHRLDSSGSGPSIPSADASEPAPSGEAPPMLAPYLIQSTALAAARLAAGHPLAGVVPARVVEVAMGVIRVMARTRITAALFIAAIGTLAAWGAWAGQSGSSAPESRPSTAVAAAPGGAQESPPIHFARAEIASGQDATRPGKRAGRPSAELPADFPAFVVETQPKLGDPDVDSSTVKEIRVTFSKPMTDKTWSWTSGNVYAFPESAGPVHYEDDMRTCVMPAKLEPGKVYVIGINGGRFNNFKDKDGKPALPYTIAFRTRSAK